ncbi:MAG: hypothetical protein EOL97_08980 [Spirochaetia bacterium]|nr:hypothetical protein [Spirochaetia bacterium]
MKTFLYLDDERTPIEDYWIIVRNYEEFVDYIKKNGIPDHISFDHDLHFEHYNDYVNNYPNINYDLYEEKTGYDCAKWLCEYCDEHQLEIKSVGVHSFNEIGSNNILQVINNYKTNRHGKREN